MSLTARLMLINALLVVGVAGQWALSHHLRAGGELGYAEIARPISQLPLVIAASSEGAEWWRGKTNPHEDVIRTQLPFTPDDLVSRTYVLDRSGFFVNLYMVYSRQGDDRKHHPEVCIRDVAGAPEDESARRILWLGDDITRPVQRFRFRTSATHHTTVYYWHYTFPRNVRDGETRLQVLHQRLSQPPPSITVQVSTLAEVAELDDIEKSFLTPLDQAMWKTYLPQGTTMATDRMPIALIRR
jgi:Protein of unknown function (DUF3485)